MAHRRTICAVFDLEGDACQIWPPFDPTAQCGPRSRARAGSAPRTRGRAPALRALDRAAGGAKFEPMECPGADAPKGMVAMGGKPLCVRRIISMPASRIELWISYRDANGNLAKRCPRRRRCCAPPGTRPARSAARGRPSTSRRSSSWARAPPRAPRSSSRSPATRTGCTSPPTSPRSCARTTSRSAPRTSAPAGAGPLAPDLPGHRRQNTLNFGMGYEEIDEKGDVVPGTTSEILPFNPDRPTICVPLGPGNTPVHEARPILNIADEDHSFHMHQVRFSVLKKIKFNGQVVPGMGDPGILHDSIPLKHSHTATASPSRPTTRVRARPRSTSSTRPSRSRATSSTTATCSSTRTAG